VVHFKSEPEAELLRVVADRLRDVLHDRFPAAFGFQLHETQSEHLLLSIDVSRGSANPCLVTEMKYSEWVTPFTRVSSINPTPSPYMGTLELTIQRFSSTRQSITLLVFVFVILTGLVKILNEDAGNAVALLSSFIIAICLVFFALGSIRARLGFPYKYLDVLKSDYKTELCDAGLLQNETCVSRQYGPLAPFASLPRPRRVHPLLVIGPLLAVVIAVIIIVTLRPSHIVASKPLSLADAQTVVKSNQFDYQQVKNSLLPLAKAGDKQALCLLGEVSWDQRDDALQPSLAELGEPAAEYHVCGSGLYEQQAFGSCFRMLKNASDRGYADESHELSQYFESPNYHPDKSEARKYHLAAANQGVSYDQCRVSEYYDQQNDLKSAYFWLAICNKSSGADGASCGCRSKSLRLRRRLGRSDLAAQEIAADRFIKQKREESNRLSCQLSRWQSQPPDCFDSRFN
jgi:hypothetical protein